MVLLLPPFYPDREEKKREKKQVLGRLISPCGLIQPLLSLHCSIPLRLIKSIAILLPKKFNYLSPSLSFVMHTCYMALLILFSRLCTEQRSAFPAERKTTVTDQSNRTPTAEATFPANGSDRRFCLKAKAIEWGCGAIRNSVGE